MLDDDPAPAPRVQRGFWGESCGCTVIAAIPIGLGLMFMMPGIVNGQGFNDLTFVMGAGLAGSVGALYLLVMFGLLMSRVDFSVSGWWHWPVGILAVPALATVAWLANTDPPAMHWVGLVLGLAALWGAWSLVEAWRHQGKRFRRSSRVLVVIGLVVTLYLGLYGYLRFFDAPTPRLGSVTLIVLGLAITVAGRALMRGPDASRAPS